MLQQVKISGTTVLHSSTCIWKIGEVAKGETKRGNRAHAGRTAGPRDGFADQPHTQPGEKERQETRSEREPLRLMNLSLDLSSSSGFKL